MKRNLILTLLALIACITLSSCFRSRCEVWEDTKTCGRYMEKGVRSLFGQHVDSREYANFYEKWEDGDSGQASEFLPLADASTSQSLTVHEYPISKESPGDPGSNIPGIQGFHTPSGKLAQLFSNVHFATDSYSIQGTENITSMREIAQFLKDHPKTYIFIEGHADERGPAAYNLSLGVRRANAIRAFLIDNHVNPDQLFTISYGLERPIALGHDEIAWKLNRRAEFKLYDR